MTDSKPRGFAAMSPETRQRIAALGGHAVQKLKKAHRFSIEEAREAGRKGGIAVSQNREHMSDIGKRGGHASKGVRRRPARLHRRKPVVTTHEEPDVQPSPAP